MSETSNGGIKPVPVQDMEDGHWYIPGHDREEAWYVDDPDDLLIEETWMRPVPPPPKDVRDDWGIDTPILRDERGRFRRGWWWEVCHKDHPDAVPYMEVRYPPL